MAQATAPVVSRETLEDRLRMASTKTEWGAHGAQITSSKDSLEIARSIESLVNRIVEDGIALSRVYPEEGDAFADFHNAILLDIDRQIVDFAYKLENEIRPAARSKLGERALRDGLPRASDGSIIREGVSGWNT